MNLATKESIFTFILGLFIIIFFGYAQYEKVDRDTECFSRENVKEYIKECSYKQDVDICKYNAIDLFCRNCKLKTEEVK